MTRRDRLMATLQGRPVDRPAVSFYELNGLDEDPFNHDPYNIYNDPSWRPLIDLTREKTDRIVMRSLAFNQFIPDPVDEYAEISTYEKDGSRFTERRIKSGTRVLTSVTRLDKDVNTLWTLEHLIKDMDDLNAFLELPPLSLKNDINTSIVLNAEATIGDTGIVMIDTPDPLCLAAGMFDMSLYTIVAMTEPELFHRLLEKFAAVLQFKTDLISKALPGRLWRIYGPEYAAAPYLPADLFYEYVNRYDEPMIRSIHHNSGFARIHSHGNLMGIIDHIIAMGADAIDPIEPPHQGDAVLKTVREKYGKQLVLFGNLEITDIENMPTHLFREVVKQSVQEGMSGTGRGFVLMPSACPYGRKLPAQTMKNYEAIVDCIERI